MADITFDQVKVNQFSKTVTDIVTQTDSFLKPYVTTEMITGEFFETNTVGAVNASYKSEYNQRVEYKDISHARRGKSLETIYTPVLIDKQQFSEVLIDIDGAYTKEVAASMQRELDQIILNGMLGSYQSGKNFGTTNNWSNVTSGATLNTLDYSGASFSLNNAYEIAQTFMARGHGLLKDSKICLTITEKQSFDLAREANSAKKELYPITINQSNGSIEKAGTINFIVVPSSPVKGIGLLSIVSSKRVGVAFVANSAVKLGISKDISLEVLDHPDFVESYAIKSVGRMGALRVTDDQVIKVLMQP